MKPINFISIFAKHTNPKFQWEKTRFFKVNFRWRENEKLFSHPYFCQKTTQNQGFLPYFARFWGVLVSHETLTQNQIVPRETYVFGLILTRSTARLIIYYHSLPTLYIWEWFWIRICVDIRRFCCVFTISTVNLSLFKSLNTQWIVLIWQTDVARRCFGLCFNAF